MGLDAEKIGEYLMILVFAYVCLAGVRTVLHKKETWGKGLLYVAFTPIVVYGISQIVQYPINLELVLTVTVLNLLLFAFSKYLDRRS